MYTHNPPEQFSGASGGPVNGYGSVAGHDGSQRRTTHVTETVSPRWQDADEAVQSLVACLAAAAQTTERSARKRPRGRSGSKRRPKSTRRHIAEVIRAHRLAPGLRVDRNMVAALFLGHRDLVTNPVLVVAVAQACSIIAGRKLSAKKAARMRAASLRIAELIARADADTQTEPLAPPPVAPPVGVPVGAPFAAPFAAVVPARAAAPVAAPVAVPAPVAASVAAAAPVAAWVAVPAPVEDGAGRRRRRSVRRWWAAAVLLLIVLALVTLGWRLF
jgi:hypothetical protein